MNEGKERPSELKPLGTAVEGTVVRAPEFAGSRMKLEVMSERIFRGDRWVPAEGKIMLTLHGHRYDIMAGDSVKFVTELREPWNYGNPGEFDYKSWLNTRGIFATGFIKNGMLLVKTKDGGGLRRYVDYLRADIRGFIDGLDIGNKEPLKALIIAEQRGIDKGLKDAFIITGTYHIISISGLHIGIVVLFFYKIFLFVLKRSERLALAFNVRKIALALSIIPAVFYGLLAGFPVSTERSVIMVAAYAFTFMLNRGRDYLNTIALAAVVILLVYPYAIWDISFQLSFAAVTAIVYLAPRLAPFFVIPEDKLKTKRELFLTRVWNKRLLPAILVTVSAGIATGPILAYHFNMLSLTGIAANIIAVPISGAIIPLLFVSSFVSWLWAWPAAVILHAADILFELMARVIKAFASLPLSSIRVSTPTFIEMGLFYVLILAAINIKRARAYAYAASFALIALSMDWGYWNLLKRGEGELKVTFISVGQGESGLVEFPGGKRMLIDGGGVYSAEYDIGEKVIAPLLWSKKITALDYVVLSHAQLDHMGGLKFIAENFEIGEFWWNGDGELGALEKSLSNKGVRVRKAGGLFGEEISRYNIDGVNIDVVHPLKDYGFDKNNMSMVMRLSYGNASVLFTGDIGEDAERELLGSDVRSTVLKAPHHGSRKSSTPEFLEKVSPSIIVVSAGRKNVFGFPHEETLERYRRAGAEVFRTDKDGAITFITDGGNHAVSGYLTGQAPWSIIKPFQ
ncbi:MAG: DNA internalization-related competence protein ComEC/Rec2 [Deltaproteobacteria bacterium]|nr:DNA internalization-related competence protein ComEC/Rec2 [Deltaproteobacteria bacterium]